MKNRFQKTCLLSYAVASLLFLFGCGDPSGQKEYSKAQTLYRRGELVRAQGEFKKAIRKLSQNNEKAEANNQLALILWQLGKHNEAITHFKEACRLSDRISIANENLAIALFQVGKAASSEFEFRQILNEKPENSTALFYLGLIQLREKKPKEAVPFFSKVLLSDPNNPEAQTALALAEFHSNPTSDTAIKRLEKVASTFPNYAPASYNLAVLYDQFLHQPASAEKYYTQYLSISKGTDLKEKEAKNALNRLKEKRNTPATNESAPKATFYSAKGSRLYAAKNYRDAIVQFRRALQMDPSSKTAYYNLGLSYYALKEYSAAIQSYKSALQIDSSFSDARYMLALSYCQLKQWNEAKQQTATLRQIDPQRANTLKKYIESIQNR